MERLRDREMKVRSHSNQPPARPRWKSLGQLAELWGLSRARTRAVLKGLVQSGRMEVRTLERDRSEVREYRIVPPSRAT